MSDDNNPQGPGPGGNPWVKSLMVWGGIFLALLLVVSMFGQAGQAPGPAIGYSEFRERVVAGTVKDVGKKISDKVKGEKAKLSDGERLASRSKRPAVSLFRACLQLTVLSQTRTSCARCRRRASRPSPSPAAKAAPM